MIGYLAGTFRHLEIDAALIVVGGVGYRVLMPVPDLARAHVGAECEVWVHTHVREDAIVLFGFASREGLVMFERLVAVQGVGPKTALALLSGIDASELPRVIGEKDEARLTKIPGVGKKTAARIVLELAEKMAKESLASPSSARGRNGQAGALDDLRSALANLGYKAPQIDRAVQKVKPHAEEGATLSDLVREALRHVQ
jgi:Holliday junction DNA helicase RuvA